MRITIPTTIVIDGESYRLISYSDHCFAHHIEFVGERSGVAGECSITDRELLLAPGKYTTIDLIYDRLRAAVRKAVERNRNAERSRPVKRAMASRARRRRAASKASSL